MEKNDEFNLNKLHIILIVIFTYLISVSAFLYNYSKDQSIWLFKSDSVSNIGPENDKTEITDGRKYVIKTNKEEIPAFSTKTVPYSPQNLEKALKSYKTFIFFSLNNCNECTKFIDSVNLDEKFYDDVIIIIVDVNQDRNLLSKYKVNSVNTIIQLDNNGIVINKYRSPTLQSFKESIK